MSSLYIAAEAVISAIRVLPDSKTKNLIKVLQHDKDIIDILTDYLQDVSLEEDNPRPKSNVPMELTTLVGESVWQVPKATFDTILAGEPDEILSLKEYYGGKVFSEWMMLLRYNDRDLGPVIEIDIEDGGQMATYFTDGVMLGSDMLNVELFELLEKKKLDAEARSVAPDTLAFDKKQVRTLAGTSPRSPIKPRLGLVIPDLEPERVVKTSLKSLETIDLSKGPGQYIGGKTSESILQSDWSDGMRSHDIRYCENTFRLLNPRKRLDKLREVYHTKPSNRGAFDILLFQREDVVFLRYKGRLLTMGKAHELPRSPDWKAELAKASPSPKELAKTPIRIKDLDDIYGLLEGEVECT